MNLKGKLLTAMAIGFVGAMSLNPGNAYAGQASINEVESNDTFETANVVDITGAGTYEVNGAFRTEDGQETDDYFKLVCTNPGKLNISITNTTDINYSCSYEIYDSEYINIGCEYGYMHKAGAVYYIKPKHGGVGSPAHTYKFTITEDESKAYEQEDNNTRETATVLSDGVVVTGSIESSSSSGNYGEDYYKFTVPKNKYATLTFGGDDEAALYDSGNAWKVTVYDNSKKIRIASEGNVSWEDTVNIENRLNKDEKPAKYDTKFYEGTYYVKVKSSFLGMTKPYNISFNTTDIPKTSISKVTTKKSGMTARWAVKKDITGYQVQYSTNKNFKGAKTANIKSAKKVTTTINKLKAGKKYFVRIRTYKTFDKKNYYSTWSKVKAITIKK